MQMRTDLLSVWRCPRCKADQSSGVGVENDDEVREGELTCRVCGERRAIEGGIVDLLSGGPQLVLRVRAGLNRFADVMDGAALHMLATKPRPPA